jgi:hypothetical protein
MSEPSIFDCEHPFTYYDEDNGFDYCGVCGLVMPYLMEAK